MDRELIVAVSDLTCRYAGAPRDALRAVSLEVRASEFHALLGPNGSGKTTLLRAALGLVRPLQGRAEILGRPAGDWSRRDLARVVGVVPQREENLFPQRVHETVLLGRYPHLSLFGGVRAADRAAVERALVACDAADLADRWLWTLSGGEYQRVRLARALAQEPKLLVLDEPTVSLDLRHEMELFELVRTLVDGFGLAALMITHHVNLAARFADQILILAEGRAVARGAPAAVLTRETVERVFSSLFLRGGESDYVKVLVDGVPQNQPGGAFDFADLTTDNVDRIEIVRGPASVLYGSDAVTGVIQIFTRTGSGAPRVTAAARAGTYGSAEYETGLAGGGSRASYSVTVSRLRSDGLYPYNNQYRNTVVSGRVRVAPDDRTDASLTYRWGDDTYHFPTNGAGQPVDSNQFSADRGPSLSVDAGRRFGAGLEVRGVAALRELRLRSEDRPDSPGEDGSFESRDFVRRASGGVLATWRRAAAAVTAGIDYEDERQTGRSVFTASFGTFPDSINVLRWNTGYYAQALFTGASPLSLTLGGRVDDNSQFGPHG